MLYMVIERYADDPRVIYERFERCGRMLPDGLEYIDSWVDISRGTCYQLMRTDSAALFDLWTSRWADIVDFEIVEVTSSADAKAALTVPESKP